MHNDDKFTSTSTKKTCFSSSLIHWKVLSFGLSSKVPHYQDSTMLLNLHMCHIHRLKRFQVVLETMNRRDLKKLQTINGFASSVCVYFVSQAQVSIRFCHYCCLKSPLDLPKPNKQVTLLRNWWVLIPQTRFFFFFVLLLLQRRGKIFENSIVI
jgi:hypothetical protein